MSAKKQMKMPSRRQALFQYGLTPTEIHTLIKEKKTEFIKCGVKNANNLPVDISKRIEFLSQNLSKPEAQKIVLDWVGKNIEHKEEHLTSDILQQLDMFEQTQDGDDENCQVWRSLLVNWSVYPEDKSITDYVFGGLRKKPVIDQKQSDFSEDLVRGKALLNGTLNEVAKGDAFGCFISALVDAFQGKPRFAEEFIDEIKSIKGPAAETMSSILHDVIDKRISSINLDQYELNSSLSAERLSRLDNDSFTVIAKMATNGGAGHKFFRITGLIIGNALYALTKEDAQRIFPISGSAILFASKAPSYQLPYLSDWVIKIRIIDERSDEHTSRFEVFEIIRRIHDIQTLPYSSEEPDSVREWILENSKSHEGGTPLYQLDDGYVGKFKSLQPRLDEPLECYTIRKAFKFENRIVVIDDIGKPTSYIDCSPPDVLIRKLLSFTKSIEGFPKLTNAQIIRLAEVASDELAYGHSSSSILRLCGNINNLYANHEVSVDLIKDILSLPQIIDQIEAEKALVRANYESQLVQEKRELSELRSQKSQLESAFEEQKKSNAKLAAKLTEKIKGAYKKATEDGIELLADTAILKPFLSGGEGSQHSKYPAKSEETVDLSKFSDCSSVDDLDYLHYQLGAYARINSLKVSSLTKAASLIVRHGLVLTSFKLTDTLVRCFSSVASGGLSGKVSISTDVFGVEDVLNLPVYDAPFLSPISLGSLIEASQNAELPLLINIVGANRAPLETYLPEILQCSGYEGIGRTLSWRSGSQVYKSVRISSPLYVVISFVDGKSSFKLPPEFVGVAPFIPAASIWSSNNPKIDLHFAPSKFDFKSDPLGIASQVKVNQDTLRNYLDCYFTDNDSITSFEALCFAIGRGDTKSIQDIISSDKDEEFQTAIRTYLSGKEYEFIKSIITAG